MNKETMTVHQALSELKVLDKRIRKETAGIAFVVAKKVSMDKVNGVPAARYVDETRDAYRSVRTLINRRNAIKRAVTRSNAETVVNIGGTEYTVAEAIDMKNFGMSYVEEILLRMEAQYKAAAREAELQNGERLEQRADAYVRSLYENADMKNLSDEVRKVRDEFIRSQTAELVDPVHAADEMKKLKDEADRFLVNVDSALSVSNALTSVSVEYETL